MILTELTHHSGQQLAWMSHKGITFNQMFAGLATNPEWLAVEVAGILDGCLRGGVIAPNLPFTICIDPYSPPLLSFWENYLELNTFNVSAMSTFDFRVVQYLQNWWPVRKNFTYPSAGNQAPRPTAPPSPNHLGYLAPLKLSNSLQPIDSTIEFQVSEGPLAKITKGGLVCNRDCHPNLSSKQFASKLLEHFTTLWAQQTHVGSQVFIRVGDEIPLVIDKTYLDLRETSEMSIFDQWAFEHLQKLWKERKI